MSRAILFVLNRRARLYPVAIPRSITCHKNR
jgi:hypothetical protein